MNSYRATAYDPRTMPDRCNGTLRIHGGHAVFVHDAGKLMLPGDRLVVRRGGANDRLIFFEHPDLPGASIFTADKSCLNDPTLANMAGFVASMDDLNGVKRRKILVALVAVAVLIAIPIAFIAAWQSTVRFAASQVPVAWEESLSDAIRVQYDDQGALQPFPELDDLARPLLDELENERDYQFEFFVVDDPTLNAFAAPGGLVVVHSGLIAKSESAEALLGVLAHELAHVTEQHGLRGLINSLGWYVAIQLVVGDSSGLAALLVQSAPFLIHQQYSQGFEADADEKAVALMHAADINPQGLVVFFEQLLDDQGSDLTGLEESLSFLSSHPTTSERITAIRQHFSDEPREWADLDHEFDQLRSAVADWRAEVDTAQEGEL